MIAARPGLHELSGPALAECASLHGGARLTVHVTGHAGTTTRRINPDGSVADAQDRYLELFCIAKPIVALSVLARSTRLGIDVDAPLRSRLTGIIDVDDEVTVATLLSHGSRLAGVPAVSWMTTPVDERERHLGTPQGAPGTNSYSEVQAGAILASIWPSLAGETLDESVSIATAAWGVDPCGILFGGDAARRLAPSELEPLWVSQGDTSIPMLHLLAPEYRGRQSIAFSSLARPSAVHAFFVASSGFLGELEQQVGTDQGSTGIARPVVHDEVHRRENRCRPLGRTREPR